MTYKITNILKVLESLPLTIQQKKSVLEKHSPIIEQINVYLMDVFSYKTPPMDYKIRRATIANVNRKRVELRIVFHDNLDVYKCPTIAIARIEFNPQRKGVGTAFLKFITRIALDYHYEQLAIEKCGTEEILGFVNKFGFTQINIDGTYTIAISQLAHYFDAPPLK